jgi:ATP-dependent Clp protease ATP-binding subunit ClpA
MVADLLDERRRSGERLIFEFREGGFEEYSKRHPDLARELEVVTVVPPDAAESRQLLEAARTKLQQSSGIRIDDDVLAQTERLARERWPRLVAPWPALITIWNAAAIQNESASRGDLHRLEQDIAELESSGKADEADLLRRHVEGLRGVGQALSLESIRQAISELADKPSAHF